jgi:hypothetical protein
MEQPNWLPKRLIVCGDSFNIGIGCNDLNTEPYAVLIAQHYGIPVINLAKGSSTNLSIWLQVQHAVERLAAGADDLVLVNETSSNRFNWFPESYKQNRPLSNHLVNYHQYPPYGADSYHHRLPAHPMQHDPEYQGVMYTENIAGVYDYYDNFHSKGYNQQGRYYDRLTTEPPQRLKLMMDFYASIYDENISQLQSQAFMMQCHLLLSRHNVRHLMMLPNPAAVQRMVPEPNLFRLQWGEITLEYPDTIPSGHAHAGGHQYAARIISDKLKQNGWM